MLKISRTERQTQNRVIALFSDKNRADCLTYDYLGKWDVRGVARRCIEEEYLTANLRTRGYSDAHIRAALQQLWRAADTTGVSLYAANMRTYQLLRYGVPVQISAGENHETVHLIDWQQPENNHFAIAEEVTLNGHDGKGARRPDLVVYLNGIAVAVLELKRASVEVGDGIRQLITNQEAMFNQPFFATVQLLVAGNDAQGLRYGTVGTPEKFFVPWKIENRPPENAPLPSGYFLDTPLAEIFNKKTLLDLMRHFIIFDAGQKKVPRTHQYHAIKAAQAKIKQCEGGIIWHTQGSGKSILMVLLAKWLLEYQPDARILIITDRDELDKQIEGVMRNAGVLAEGSASPRITSRRELVQKLGQAAPRLMCALIHKFDTQDLSGSPPSVVGRLYVFVDECHRSQGGDMHKQMRRWLSSAIFIGFTGTPLLRKDKKTTRDVFGDYIHTYKFNEAVADNVVLDLKYEARHITQEISSKEKIDEWFKRKTQGLNEYQRALLKKHWGTLEKLMSSKGRKEKIIADIIYDFEMRPRLNNGRGTAILVAPSIYDACHYFRLFQETRFGSYCGIITSYEPQASAISHETQDSDERYKFQTYTQYVLVQGQNTTQYEEETKRLFIKEPAKMKLLIVVSKLLTGFDAPSCTYIYLDNELQDHNLFQAICRTNRLDGEDKDYGYIIDYKQLFKNVQNAIAVYTADALDTNPDGSDDNITVKDWLQEGKKRLDETREALQELCEPVPAPQSEEAFLAYFCPRTSDTPETQKIKEQLRIFFYKSVTAFLRAYANIASDLEQAGYSRDDIQALKKEALFYADLLQTIKHHSAEELDIKRYEGEMRHLINTYIKAQETEKLGTMHEMSLVELIVQSGIHNAIANKLNSNGKLSEQAVAEGVAQNVRQTIVRKKEMDPQFYEHISKRFEELLEKYEKSKIDYEQFLENTETLLKQMMNRQAQDNAPATLAGNAAAAVLFRNLAQLEKAHFTCPSDEAARVALAQSIDQAVREHAQANWRGDQTKERLLLRALSPLMQKDKTATQALLELVKKQSVY